MKFQKPYIKKDKYKGIEIISTVHHETATTFGLIVETPQIKSGLKSEYMNVSIDDLEFYWASGLESERERINDFIKKEIKPKLNALGFYKES
jgi:hypothetical protein